MEVRLDMAPRALGRVAMRTNPLIEKGDGAIHRLKGGYTLVTLPRTVTP